MWSMDVRSHAWGRTRGGSRVDRKNGKDPRGPVSGELYWRQRIEFDVDTNVRVWKDAN